MNKYLPFLTLAFFVTACSSNPAEIGTKTLQSSQQTTNSIDTAGLSAFQQWKAQNELEVTTPPQQQVQPLAQAPVRTVTVIREERVPQQVPVRKTVKQKAPAPMQERPAPVEETQPASAGTGDVATNTGAGNSTGDAPASQGETAKKEGMSNSTKGAVIGSAGGAVIGAVINKRNRGVGAVIGGVVGGAVGYGLGKKKDSKETQQ